MAATLSDNLNIAKAPPVGAFVLRRYDRGIRGMHCISTPVISPRFVKGTKMIEYIKSLPGNIHDHFAAMTTFIFILSICKIALPFVGYLINRVFEYKSYKRFSEVEGMSDERAREIAREIWRPKTKLPKWFLKIKNKLLKKQ